MKIFISADIEGISGVSNKDFAGPKHHNWELGRRYMVEDVNAAIEGALRAAPDSEITVRDAHGGSDNIVLEKLHPKASLVAGWPRDFNMLQGLDRSFDACFFVGYHAGSLVPGGVLSHTYSGTVRKVTIGGLEVGETGVNAFAAGGLGVPVALATGDDRLEREVSRVLPGAKMAVVKKGAGRECCEMLPLERAREIIRTSAAEAVQGLSKIKPPRFRRPLDFRVRLSYSDELAAVPSLSDFKTSFGDGVCDVTVKGRTPQEIYDRFLILLRLSFPLR